MFNAQKNQQPAPTKSKATPASSAVTILTSGCHFNGKLFCRGSSRIGGKIEGHVVSEGLLIIEEEAIITAEIKADEVIIQGTVQGKLVASQRVELCATAHFEGDIAAPVLIVREGAQFNGRSSMIAAEAPTAKGGPRALKVEGKGKEQLPEIGSDLKGQHDVSKMKAPDINLRGA